MLDKIKLAMRISHNMLDDDIQQNIDACLGELARVGVDTSDAENNTLIIKACEIYCKYTYDFDGKGEDFFKHFEKLRNSLSRSEGYSI